MPPSERAMKTDEIDAVGALRAAGDDAAGVVAVERHGPQLRLTIRRVDKHNALSRSLLAAIRDAVSEAASDTDVSYVVLTGEGPRYFCAGGDLVELAAIRSIEQTTAFGSWARSALDAIRTSPLPVIAYLNGDALGGGAELAMACDLRVTSPAARIGYVQGRLAMTSAWGGAADLCAAVGPSRAFRMMARAELLGADQALSDGLVEAIVEGGLEGLAARSFFASFDALPRHVLVALKANVSSWRAGMDYQRARDVEQEGFVSTWMHQAHWDALERVFSDTRRPRP